MFGQKISRTPNLIGEFIKLPKNNHKKRTDSVGDLCITSESSFFHSEGTFVVVVNFDFDVKTSLMCAAC